ncbi:MAG: hypothetical protein IK121_01815, partial [Lachnospiraceae bacterium]|nr:hypothetical protein [Lachnospiraceae bacterium]
TNKEGQKVYSVQIITEEIEFAESQNSSGAQPAAQQAVQTPVTPVSGPQPVAKPVAEPVAQLQTPNDGFMNIPDGIDEELPFN